jgi:chitin synthase
VVICDVFAHISNRCTSTSFPIAWPNPKSFESLFGSVTCLPGCFTLYRLRTPDTHKPLLISNQIIQDYSENRVDTLHMKNLHLGEDRYLTTLLLKHFPLFKTQFVRDAHAFTTAPDDWKVLLRIFYTSLSVT